MVNDPEQKIVSLLTPLQSTHTASEDESAEEAPEHPSKTTLAQYVERMPEGQEAIYFVTAPNLAAAKGSPHLEGYKAKGYEVLLMIDPSMIMPCNMVPR